MSVVDNSSEGLLQAYVLLPMGSLDVELCALLANHLHLKPALVAASVAESHGNAKFYVFPYLDGYRKVVMTIQKH